ncbi:MAG: bifunctional 5,10-methylenetetrahydrofolate dehydrogenase/5,10-methenyltetrahydrofolate cyclohydrolase [Prevotellaceae bacterium]|jgi:methylenetetrahydrofolate dehydrogenase (NADP+)/methenyltetrahydrofolate cyclohydrolase|nr:bifunctional 5,10-methylenetetrahydrofolate dehydrogenase/5,10-methenyltetrahydrofolate cyclohydrolase [Prevotellaceae bacterium]
MELLYGNVVASKIEAECFETIKKINQSKGKNPHIHVFQFGNDLSGSAYVKRIGKNCDKFGIKFNHLVFDDSDSFRAKLAESVNNNDVSAIMIQQPLPKELATCIDTVPFVKDVEGVTANSLGRLFKGEPCMIPCTAQAVVEIIDYYNITTEGKKIAIAGRSNIVGKPLSVLLLNKNATVTVCHSKTQNIEQELKNSDIIVLAVGVAGFLKIDAVNKNSIIIDVGTNYVDGKLVGDACFDDVKDRVAKITPVPGGVGVVTNALLIRNIINSYLMQTTEKG